MTEQTASGSGHTDILQESWINRFLPPGLRPYALLARLDRPIGTWLLLFPCWWSIALAAGEETRFRPDWTLILLFGIGAVVMRGAGCTLNDILDRDIDAKVERTRSRPLPSGAVTLKGAILFLALQLLLGALVLFSLNRMAIGLGIGVLALVGTYPLMKRVTWWPQFFLGLNFNFGALMGFAAATGTLALSPLLLYAGGVFWTLGYDTVYAHQDRADDAAIGVKSTALRLGGGTARALAVFYAATILFWAASGLAAHLSTPYWIALAAAAVHFVQEIRTLDIDDAADCLKKFRAHGRIGWLLLLGIVLAKQW